MPQLDTSYADPGPRRPSLFKPLLGVLAVLAGLVFLTWEFRRPSALLSRGVSLEQVDLQPLTGDGKPIGPHSFKGRVTLVNFWGTWCPPCREEFPHVVAMGDRFREQTDFQLVSVSSPYYPDTTLDELKAETVEFLAMQNANIPTYANPKQKPFIESFPTTILVDREGTVTQVWQGYWPGLEEEIQTAVERQLARK